MKKGIVIINTARGAVMDEVRQSRARYTRFRLSRELSGAPLLPNYSRILLNS